MIRFRFHVGQTIWVKMKVVEVDRNLLKVHPGLMGGSFWRLDGECRPDRSLKKKRALSPGMKPR